MIKTNNKAIIALFLSTFLFACSFVPPDESQHPRMLDDSVIEKQAQQISEIKLDWYKEFSDPQLNDLVERGLQANLDLVKARQNIDIAAEQIAIANAGLLPQVTGQVSGGQSFSKIGHESGDSHPSISALPYLSYHFDFWDKYKSIKTAAINNKLASDALAAQTRLSVISAIASSYFSYKTELDNIHIFDRLIQDQVNQNKVFSIQVERSLINESVLLQNKGNIASLKLQQEQAINRRELAKNQLALLLAITPNQLEDLIAPSAKPIKELVTPDYIPLNLLGQRPDIIASKWMVEARREKITEERAAYYPDFNLSVLGTVQKLISSTPDKIILGSASIAASLPLYDAGVRDANFNIANIEYDQAITNYNAQLLVAAREASDAIADTRSAINEKQLAKNSTNNYYGAYQIEKNRFKRGLSAYTEMNTARIQWNQQLIKLQESKNKVFQSQLKLIVALGGGYQENKPEK